MNEKQCQNFLSDYVKQFDGQKEMTEEAFKLIFN